MPTSPRQAPDSGPSTARPATPASGWRRLKAVVRIVALLVVAAAVVALFRQVDWTAFVDSIKAARLPWLALATGLELLRLLSRALLWRVSLHTRPPVPFGRLVRYTFAAMSASMFTPARAGEALRPWLLRQEHQTPLRQSIGVALGEKILDGLALLVLVLPLPWLVPLLPVWATRTIEALAVITLPGLALGWWIGRHRVDAGWTGRFLGQIRILREPGTLALAFLFCLAGWLLDLTALYATMRAVGVRETLAAAAFVLLVINVALFVPTTPGNVGTLEAAAVFAMHVLKIDRPPAVAVAVLYHAIQLAPLMLFAILHPRMMLGARSRELRALMATAASDGPSCESQRSAQNRYPAG